MLSGYFGNSRVDMRITHMLLCSCFPITTYLPSQRELPPTIPQNYHLFSHREFTGELTGLFYSDQKLGSWKCIMWAI